MTIHEMAQEGFRRASTREERIAEAAKLFAAGKSGADHAAQYRLLEAFTTSDFPELLGAAFSKQAVAAQKAAVKEFEPILSDVTVDDFNEHKLVDLWNNDAFEEVAEGEEYKGGTLSETSLTHKARKNGRNFGLTWELRRNRNFSALANFPIWLGNGSVKGQNIKTAKLLTTEAGDGWSTTYFGTIDTPALTSESLQAAIRTIGQRTNHRGELVSTTDLVLIHGPGLRYQVNYLLNAQEIEVEQTNGNKVTKTRTPNPFRGAFVPLESKSVADRLGANAGTGWALVQGNGSDLPSVIRTLLSGEENVDIRLKDDAGRRVGGGDISPDQGSFKDDTIWYRGRDVYGIDPGFTEGVYASNGTV
ncbi:phage major capsid protein [Zhihengliuella flava]|uniref:Uncharacterized protein n=1 Tax=Zhihengliuella flava TaxID=1285193 RepID=A0A931GMW2_9MICC|nr:hypothetical protein [Zhihengliuella flava]MBG6085819.1 hypothetical protein [Zhihengliuella flava]